MTFEEFQSSAVALADLRVRFDELTEYLEPVPGIVYAGTFYITQVPGRPGEYSLLIGNCEWVGEDLDVLENIMWENFAQAELELV